MKWAVAPVEYNYRDKVELEALGQTYHHYLDLTPFGRGEGWGGMPDLDGKGQDWLRYHDRYEA